MAGKNNDGRDLLRIMFEGTSKIRYPKKKIERTQAKPESIRQTHHHE